MKKLKHFLAAALILLTTGLIATPALVSADFKGAACNGLNTIDDSSSTSTTCPATAGQGVTHLLTLIINIMSWLVGITAVIMIIFGGFKFITAAGDPNKNASARNTIIYALIGLVVAVSAQVLVHFVLGSTAKAVGTLNGGVSHGMVAEILTTASPLE